MHNMLQKRSPPVFYQKRPWVNKSGRFISSARHPTETCILGTPLDKKKNYRVSEGVCKVGSLEKASIVNAEVAYYWGRRHEPVLTYQHVREPGKFFK